MNIAVISIRDLLKYILKFIIIICIILFLTNVIKNISKLKQEDAIKYTIENATQKINEYSFLNCLDLSIPLMSYTKTENKSKNFFSSNIILGMGAGVLEESIINNTDLVINQDELTTDDAEELVNQIAELPESITTESVSQNNITPKVTTSYKSVQINNQSDYEITEDILVPNIEITNKKDIFIYHTHTCESYTPSARI